MKFWKSHFDLSTAQRNGILFLVFILLASLAFQFFWFLPNTKSTAFAFSEEDKLNLQHQLDSLQQASNKANEPKIYPFNPNYLKDYKAYQLGISVEEFNRLQKFRDDSKWINSAADFKEVTQISDSLLLKIEPYFKFPDWVTAKEKRAAEVKKYQSQLKTYAQKQNLNVATETQLQQISGIGQVLAKRIVRRRTKIGGFLNDIQLKDIWGLNYETRAKLLEEFTVKLKVEPKKIDINSASVVQLSEIPYFDYELAREIVHFIKVRQGISSFEELSKIYDFPSDKIDRIKLYLEINE
ncbi:ComEA family DNA-binding protein [Psychroflexus salis]|uniref:DNA uptake protein ComE n=1 Tax=Psychroflexus salis TaxID=1526574 RepID=A0A917A003_9FLAO|nr:helix-hairpin-helix domain-containing protein [Psychroflexus salis]GGE20833.1 hypothetical protein GCM10010831_22360 [Psychroflexus salis]